MSGISLGRVTTLLLIGRAAGYVLALGNSVILARVLGVDRLGAYAYAMGVAALFGLLPNLGISTIVTRTIARDPDAGAGVVRAAVRAQALRHRHTLMIGRTHGIHAEAITFGLKCASWYAELREIGRASCRERVSIDV